MAELPVLCGSLNYCKGSLERERETHRERERERHRERERERERGREGGRERGRERGSEPVVLSITRIGAATTDL